MRPVPFLLVVVLLISMPVQSFGVSLEATTTPHILAQDGEIVRNWTIRFVMVNYDESRINTERLLDGFPTRREHLVGDLTIVYNINYSISFASGEYENQIRQVIIDNSINGTGTGTRLDEEALQYQKDNIDEPQRIFYPRDGRSINATVLEEWLAQNPYVQPPGLGYMFYVFNFSEFDTPDHAIEHWYDYSPMDPDTGVKQDWFRLEWDNALNPDVKFEYPGFGGIHNIYVLDPSADQWYLRWARIWWDTQIDYEHFTKDLEDKVNETDLTTPAGVDSLTDYLFNYMYDPVTRLMMPRSPMSAQNDVTHFVESGLLKCLVIGMDVANGVSLESLEWVTNADMQKEHLEELFPFIEWTVDVEFLDIDQHQDWKDLFWDYAEIVDGKTIVDGAGMFNAIRQQMRWRYVDIYDENINVFGVVFIKKNMEMHVYGRQYTGLGGGGQTVIWKSWERYYRPDGVTRKAGISSIQLHETMHAIGLGHTWDLDHYVGDFSRNAMGYYGRFNGTGAFEQNWVQATYLDQLEAQITEEYDEWTPRFGTISNERADAAAEKAAQRIEQARMFYNQMDWLKCYESLRSAEDWVETMKWALRDSEPPEVLDWGIEGSPLEQNATFWATVFDETSGVKLVNVSVQIGMGEPFAIQCHYESGNWTATIEMIETSEPVRIWIVAQDKGLNIVETEVMTFGDALPELPLEMIPAASIGILALAVLVIWYGRKKGA